MRRVARIHALRPFVSGFALSLYAALAALAAIALSASLGNVVENLAAAGLSGMGSFLYAAVANTTFVVQSALAVFLAACVAVARDIAHNVRVLTLRRA